MIFKMNYLRLTRVLCVLLIIMLLTPIISLAKEIFSALANEDGSLVLTLFLLIFSFANYIITIRYCNRLIYPTTTKHKYNKLLFFLVMSIITFICSVLAIILFGSQLYELAYENMPPSSFGSFIEIMTLIGLVFFALVGPIIFFMQLQIRETLINKETSIDQLIDSIGSEAENNL